MFAGNNIKDVGIIADIKGLFGEIEEFIAEVVTFTVYPFKHTKVPTEFRRGNTS